MRYLSQPLLLKIIYLYLFLKLQVTTSFLQNVQQKAPFQIRYSFSSSSSLQAKKVVIISPPGGIGQISAISSLSKFSSDPETQVYWFIVSDKSKPNLTLNKEIVSKFYETSLLNIAGISYEAENNSDNIIKTIQEWGSKSSSSIDGFICTLDGITQDENTQSWENEMKVICKNVVNSINVKGTIVLCDELPSSEDESSSSSSILNIFGKDVPKTLMETSDSDNTAKLYYTNLFGLPDSSSNASPFEGGPRRDPMLKDEYVMRTVRMESIVSEDDIQQLSKLQQRTSRLTIGDACSVLATTSTSSGDYLVTSTRGTIIPNLAEYQSAFNAALESQANKQRGLILRYKFGQISNSKRLFDWFETKWAPVILKSYNVAGIRVGERPVYTLRDDDTQLDIVYETLDRDFKSAYVGKLSIALSSEDQELLVVKRISKESKEFQAEGILIKSLVDAIGQAIEKGLATAVEIEEEEVETREEMYISPPPPSAPAQPQQPVLTRPESGPKGRARRSTQRVRGTKGRDKGNISTSDESSFQ